MVDFKEVLAETKELARKSDLQNLAVAHVDLSKHIREATNLLKEIEELAEKEDAPEGSVSKLYHRVAKLCRAQY